MSDLKNILLRLLMNRLFFLAVALISLSATGQSNPKTSVNGCGSGWNTYLVPDSIPLLQCNFNNSCNAHDLCYGVCEKSSSGICLYRKCKKGGELYNSDQCLTDNAIIQSRIEAKARRSKCDINLYKNIKSQNKNKPVCAAFAIVYISAVKEWGNPAFNGMDDLKSEAAKEQGQEAYENAIRAYFKKGTDKQFKTFVTAWEENRSTVDFNEPLQFTAKTGLKNKEMKDIK